MSSGEFSRNKRVAAIQRELAALRKERDEAVALLAKWVGPKSHKPADLADVTAKFIIDAKAKP